MTPTYKKLLKELKLDAVYGIDIETFWGTKYTLRTMATTEYICDPRFEGQIASVMKDSWSKPKVMEWPAFKAWAKTIDWKRNGALGHHQQFDAYACQRHIGFEPAFHFDTLSMARAALPINIARNLDSLAKALGFAGKVRGGILEQTKDRHFKDFTKEEKVQHKLYAGDDISDTWGVFLKLLEFFPVDELRLINETVGLYAKPRLLLDKSMVEGLVLSEAARKQARLDALNKTVGDLQSNDKFAQLLEALGIEPPTKWSEKQEKQVWAFSKQDQAFKDLLEHESDAVQSLVEARLDIKSTSVETRARRLANRADYGPQPIYLNYWGAGPGRWSGGDKCLSGASQIKVKRAGHTMNIRLDSLLSDDLVWDGEAYVPHGGLKYQGKREVIEHDGITATEDHKVYLSADAQPVRLGDAAHADLPLEGDYGAAYWTWLRKKCQVAKDRCCNPRNKSYKNYGGRGITFGFKSGSDMAEYIVAWLGDQPSTRHSIDRIDNNRGYEPGNLRWATPEEQGQNKREYAGSERLRELCRKRPDLSYETIRTLANRGYSDAHIVMYVKGPGGRPRTSKTSPHAGDPRHAG